MLLLGIETSCDETSVSVIENGELVLSNVIFSQIKEHEIFGGVVPEIASRAHLEAINQVIEYSLNEAGKKLSEMNAIAVTNRPGLIGSLLVGVSTAKALAYTLDIPLIAVNHLQAHISAVFLKSDTHTVYGAEGPPDYPFMSLLVSGGHTALYEVNGPTEFKLLSSTRDDAAGETLDKAGKLLGLPYPGGVYLDRLSQEGNRDAFSFPRPLPNKSILEFSLSGLKNAIRVHLEKNPDSPKADVAASFQEHVINHLLEKTTIAMKEFGHSKLVVCGGVAANSRLRERLKTLSDQKNLSVWIPDRKLCTDNGAMIAAMGYRILQNSDFNSEKNLALNLNAFDHG